MKQPNVWKGREMRHRKTVCHHCSDTACTHLDDPAAEALYLVNDVTATVETQEREMTDSSPKHSSAFRRSQQHASLPLTSRQHV